MTRIARTGLLAALMTALALPAGAGAVTLTDGDIEAIGRVVVAEAAGQPIAGRVAVIDTILNRAAASGFGKDVQSVIAQTNAFEPVARAGGWQRLPPLSVAERAEIEVILKLKAGGHLGDVSGGALYFQNPAIVRARAAAGKVRPGLVDFGGMPRTVSIGDHSFYRPSTSTPATRPAVTTLATIPTPPATTRRPKALASSFVGDGISADEGEQGATILVLPTDGEVADVAAAR
jgi:hypothetical protein